MTTISTSCAGRWKARPEAQRPHRRTGKREQAQEHLTNATTMYREMRMTYWLEQAETEMGSRRDREHQLVRPGNSLRRPWVIQMDSLTKMALGGLVLGALILSGCEGLVVHDTTSLLAPRFQRSEILGFVAGAGTTFAALPDLIAMLKRRSSKGMNPRMAGITGVFQLGWIYYGLLIASRPVIAWNMVAVVINFLSVGAYLRFARRESAG